MLQPKPFFGIFGQVVQNTLRQIIKFGRQYQIIPALYLVVFSACLISYAYQPTNPPPLPEKSDTASAPPPSSIPSPEAVPTHNAYPTPEYTPTPPAAVDVATPRAYRNGDEITIRWNKDVNRVQMSVDGWILKPDCEGKFTNICKATLAQGTQLEVFWTQGEDTFSTQFKLEKSNEGI
jgi:hypothetical protein